MLNETVLAASRPASASRWVLITGLLITLLLLGVYDQPILTFLTAVWLKALTTLGLGKKAAALQQGINGGITKKLLPAVATYAVLYLANCLLLLRLLLPAPAQWRLVLRLYAGFLVVYVGIVLLGKLSHDAVWAYKLSRQLLDFLISPLPVAGLYVLIRVGFAPAPQRS